MRVSPWLRYHCEVHPTMSEALAVVVQAKPRRVYLCGGINGLGDAACKDWRAEATVVLHRGPGPTPIIIDPMARDYRGREDENVAPIVEGDKEDVVHADLILVNASRPSWGTAMEIMFAWTLRKRIVAFMESPGSGEGTGGGA